MIETKLIEIRDDGTFIPALAIKIVRDRENDPDSHWLLGRAGYGPNPCILLVVLSEPKCQYDPYEWGSNRTRQGAHLMLERDWDSFKDGDVVDAGIILGLRTEPLKSDRRALDDDVEKEFLESLL